MAKVLVTGGAGYIGSHTLVELLAAGHQPIVVDSLVNSSAESLKRVGKISGQEVPFCQLDLCDSERLNKLCASADLAAIELGWRATKTFDEACQDAWRWQSLNPNGYTVG